MPTTWLRCLDFQAVNAVSQPRRPEPRYVTLAVVVHYRRACIIDADNARAPIMNDHGQCRLAELKQRPLVECIEKA